ncbi:DUF4245 family protein [Nocardioides sp. GY 10113]|uniref:DUF4245 family protein n=1 Tax=Nocardioides sp. GY 10113 TaxID=2569761 RepID=UPI001458E590|nr:DUF4245 family protein [Nocardioides sp. GY 10113]
MSTETTPTPQASGKAGRYQRSTSGLVVSLVVTVLALGGLLGFMGLFRESPEYEPQSIDYLGSVAAAQGAGVKPTYPAELPAGWTATGVDLDGSDTDAFGLNLLTDEGQFVGIRQADDSPGSLVRAWVDEEPAEADPYRTDAADAVAAEWDGYADDGGDTGYVAEIGKVSVLVYGSAPAADLQEVVDLLTREPVEG